MEKINYKGIKSKEIIWVTYFDINHNLSFCITSDSYRDYYYLYEFDEDKNEWRLSGKKTQNPDELADIAKSKLDFGEAITFPAKEKSIVSKRGRPPKNKLF